MKVVALVSGGKDSCYAMMECVRYGHEVVCLAHLHPALDLTPEQSEIDSFMYQSVGHNVVKLIAESMELPLVTETITGKALKTDIDYHVTAEGDEVEDLFRLLEKVKLEHPDVQGACSGAIFSSYQRNRVEHVCSRLGLTSVGYLWRREQVDLLQDMVDAGMESIIVKVASIGLNPRRHLGKTIGMLQNDFLRLKERFQMNVCGEGGEYETFTLDCPLFKKRIVIDSSRVVLHSDDAFAPVAFLVIEACHLEDKELQVASSSWPPLPLNIDLPVPVQVGTVSDSAASSVAAALSHESRSLVPVRSQFRDQWHLSGIMSSKSSIQSLCEEMQELVDRLNAALKQDDMTLEDVCFVHLYVRDMSAFAAINAEYCRAFGHPMPPSRSCVEIATLPARVLLDCYAIRNSGERKLLQQRVMRDVLHVQSISAWAPNCIGPYSQANILHRSLILLAGQISLFPQTMEMIGHDHTAQARQCLINADRILEALESNLRHVCSTVVYTTKGSSESHAALGDVCRAHLIDNAGLHDEFEHAYDSDESDEDLDKDAELVALVKNVPILMVQVSHLPRNALVEVELQAIPHRLFKSLQPGTSTQCTEVDQVTVLSQRTVIPRSLCLITTSASSSCDVQLPVEQTLTQLMCTQQLQSMAKALSSALLPWDRVLHIRVFYKATAFASEHDIALALREGLNTSFRTKSELSMPALTFVPAESIQDNALMALQVTAQDLDKLETELWLRKQI